MLHMPIERHMQMIIVMDLLCYILLNGKNINIARHSSIMYKFIHL